MRQRNVIAGDCAVHGVVEPWRVSFNELECANAKRRDAPYVLGHFSASAARQYRGLAWGA